MRIQSEGYPNGGGLEHVPWCMNANLARGWTGMAEV
jgi:hypothetical protein